MRSLYDRHSWRCPPPSLLASPSSSLFFCGNLDGNDFRCETIGRKVKGRKRDTEDRGGGWKPVHFYFIFTNGAAGTEGMDGGGRCQILRERLSEGENILCGDSR